MFRRIGTPLLLLLLAILVIPGRAEVVYLEDVSDLIFTSETVATEGRTMPRLICYGELCTQYRPDVIVCVNKGMGQDGLVWQCKMPEHPTFSLADYYVGCQDHLGYNDDLLVMSETCVVYFTLHSNAMEATAFQRFLAVVSCMSFAMIGFYVFATGGHVGARG